MNANIVVATIDGVINIYPNVHIGDDSINFKLHDKFKTVEEFISEHNLDLNAHNIIIPTKTSDLTNDSNFVSDVDYIHTDNNFTNSLKSNYDNAYANSHTHSNKANLDLLSGTNTGDETQSTILSKLGITTLSGSNTGDETSSTITTKLGYTPANDTSVLHISGTETVSGVKTFSSPVTVSPSSPTNSVVIKDKNGVEVFHIKNPTAALLDTFAGYNAGNTTLSGVQNTAFGNNVMPSLANGGYNTAIGYNLGTQLTTGNRNTIIGALAVRDSGTSLSDTTSVGFGSLLQCTGNNNTALGSSAGRYIADGTTANTTSNTSVYLGSGAKANANGDINEIVIGYNAIGNGSNTVTIGNLSITKTVLNGVSVQGTYSSAPTGVEGGIYYNSTDKHFYGYNGTNWIQLDN